MTVAARTTPQPTVMQLGLAALLLHLLLILPNHPGGLAWQTLGAFPLELPVILAGMMALGEQTVGRVMRGLLVLALTLITVLKGADLAMFTAFSREFNPVADLALVAAGVRLLAGSAGPVLAGLAVLAVLAGAMLIAVGVWWATRVWAAFAPGARLARVAAGVAVLGAGVAVAEVGHAMRSWALPVAVPGAALTARIGIERLDLAATTLAGLRAFRAEASADPYRGTPGLLDRIDRDVMIVFVESYGRTSLDTPLFADLHRATLESAQTRLTGLGLSMRSGFLRSPTRGGQSWLSHATFANGLWIDGQARYGAALASRRETIFHHAMRAGFHTVAVMPQITLDWPESASMGFETILSARDLGYAGKPFNWVTMPDQFTLTAFDRLLRGRADGRALFAQVVLASSHAPWVPVPDLIDWDSIGDGRVFDAMASAGDPPEVVWRDHDRVRAQYRLAIDYSLRTVFDYAARRAADAPLMIVLGDHQAAGFVAQDDRADVPIHIIGPEHLVSRVAEWGWQPGLIPAKDTPVIAMDRMRDMMLVAFSSLTPSKAAK